MFKLLKSLPLQLVLCLLFAVFAADLLNEVTAQTFLTVSVLIMECLMFVLPVVIFSYILAALLSFEQKAPLLLLMILVLVCLSNALTVFVSYLCSIAFLPLVTSAGSFVMQQNVYKLSPLFDLSLPKLVMPEHAMFAGIVIGLFFSYWPSLKVRHFAFNLRHYVTVGLRKGFIPLLPLYMLGFAVKMQREGAMHVLLQNYGQIFALTCVLLLLYITFLYGVASNFRLKKTLGYMKEMLPAGITGFSTMSSAATMPVTLEATEKNIKDRPYAQLIIPATANIHLIGDALVIPMVGIAVLLFHGMPIPSFETYGIFIFYYCIAKFSAAGIPGGGVIILLPVLQTHLGLSAEMSSLVATLYILQDSIFSSANVMGNGAFAIITHRIAGALRLNHPPITDDPDEDKNGETEMVLSKSSSA